MTFAFLPFYFPAESLSKPTEKLKMLECHGEEEEEEEEEVEVEEELEGYSQKWSLILERDCSRGNEIRFLATDTWLKGFDLMKPHCVVKRAEVKRLRLKSSWLWLCL